eukprot:SAG31_NODE_21051_length_559_cov_0.665217_2_plen_30_part_01
MGSSASREPGSVRKMKPQVLSGVIGTGSYL